MAKPDTIAAIATAAGRAAVGIVRISGSDLKTFFGPLLGRELTARTAVLSDFLDCDGVAIDRGLALYFPAPNSYTGEDVLELHGHGGPVVLGRVLRRCVQLGARIAEPGEFTRRAYLNDKLDLAQAEGIADLIDSSSETAARAAMRSLQGEFSGRIHRLVDGLVDLRVLIEAHLDFPEEEIPGPDAILISRRLDALAAAVDGVQAAATSGARLREGSIVVLVGRPNVGKSSLLNGLAGEDVAIVTDIAGTTRDVIRRELIIDGVPIHVVDTAGLRASTDPIEQLGMERTRQMIQQADLVLVIADTRDGVTDEDLAILNGIPAGLPQLVVRNKIDLSAEAAGVAIGATNKEVRVSALTGAGMDLLKQEILASIGYHPPEEGVFLARERHLEAFHGAAEHLIRARRLLDQLELLAEELRLAQERLAAITGEFGVEALLGEIFARFCVGK